MQHHLADVAGAFNAQEVPQEQPHPSDHGLAYPESPRSVYFDAEEDAFSVDDVLSIKVCMLCWARVQLQPESSHTANSPRICRCEGGLTQQLCDISCTHTEGWCRRADLPLLCLQGVKNKKGSGVRRLLCCFGTCCKADSDAGGQAPSQVHLLD